MEPLRVAALFLRNHLLGATFLLHTRLVFSKPKGGWYFPFYRLRD